MKDTWVPMDIYSEKKIYIPKPPPNPPTILHSTGVFLGWIDRILQFLHILREILHWQLQGIHLSLTVQPTLAIGEKQRVSCWGRRIWFSSRRFFCFTNELKKKRRKDKGHTQTPGIIKRNIQLSLQWLL